MENSVDHSGVADGTTRSFPRAVVGVFSDLPQSVDERTQVIPDVVRVLCTRFPQVLHIQTLPYFCNLFTYSEVKFDRLFYLFDGMNRSSMVFASKFVGNLRKA